MNNRSLIEGTTTIQEARVALEALVRDVQQHSQEWNEAETRLQFIDRFIINCLGWPRDQLHVEVPQGRSFTDYELGKPRSVIWEAKREGRYFELPANPARRRIVQDLPSIIALSTNIAEAVTQVQNYCLSRGVQFAVICNGHQLIAFLATRNDGTPPLEGKCLVIDGHEDMLANLPTIWQNLSPAGIAERHILSTLSIGQFRGIPSKLSAYLSQYPLARPLNEEHQNLRLLADLLIEDVVHTRDVEEIFYQNCYCDSGALAQDALISHSILRARYAALFDPGETQPNLRPVSGKKGDLSLTQEVIAEAISRRPIALIGDVGVGKTSFLKHLQYVTAAEQFADSIYVYIDLGSEGALAEDLKQFILVQIETQLRERYDVDISAANFVRGVYNSDITRFENSIFSALKESAPATFERRLIEFLAAKVDNKDEHLRSCAQHIAKGRKKQFVVMIDNADQRSSEIQQQAFLIAQNLAQQWNALVFIALRPQTFHQSKRAGVLSAYSERVFSVPPPRIDEVLEKRLDFALAMATGKIPVPKLRGRISLEGLSLFLAALLHSLRENRELIELLENITGGNVRRAIDLIKQFIGSPNVNVRKILETMHQSGRYTIALHEFAKSVILGDYLHYVPNASLEVLNIFDLSSADPREHFLVPMILGFLNQEGAHRNREGFVESGNLIEEMQSHGFGQERTEGLLRRMTNKKLTETTERITFEEDTMGLIGDMPKAFRVTTIGAYHLSRWSTSFVYLDAMAFDTPILDDKICKALREDLSSQDINHRYHRCLNFRNYLSRVWREANLNPPYFDWEQLVKQGSGSFDKVYKYMLRRRPVVHR
jgi:hypothetical protein